jgi:hypothetical protein
MEEESGPIGPSALDPRIDCAALSEHDAMAGNRRLHASVLKGRPREVECSATREDDVRIRDYEAATVDYPARADLHERMSLHGNRVATPAAVDDGLGADVRHHQHSCRLRAQDRFLRGQGVCS